MLLSTDWLKEAYGIALPPELLAERLTMAGLEVDSMERGWKWTAWNAPRLNFPG